MSRTLPFIYRFKFYALFNNGKNEAALYIQGFTIQRCPIYTGIYYIQVPFIYRDLLQRGALYIQGFTIQMCPLYTGIYYIEVPFRQGFTIQRCPLYTGIYYIEVPFNAGLTVHYFVILVPFKKNKITKFLMAHQ